MYHVIPDEIHEELVVSHGPLEHGQHIRGLQARHSKVLTRKERMSSSFNYCQEHYINNLFHAVQFCEQGRRIEVVGFQIVPEIGVDLNWLVAGASVTSV